MPHPALLSRQENRPRRWRGLLTSILIGATRPDELEPVLAFDLDELRRAIAATALKFLGDDFSLRARTNCLTLSYIQERAYAGHQTH